MWEFCKSRSPVIPITAVNSSSNQTRKNRWRCEVPLGFGTAKAVIALGAVTVHASTLLTLSQELAARA